MGEGRRGGREGRGNCNTFNNTDTFLKIKSSMLHCLGLYRLGVKGKTNNNNNKTLEFLLIMMHFFIIVMKKNSNLSQIQKIHQKNLVQRIKKKVQICFQRFQSFYQDIIPQRWDQVLVSFWLLGQSFEVLTNMICFSHMDQAEPTLWNIQTGEACSGPFCRLTCSILTAVLGDRPHYYLCFT